MSAVAFALPLYMIGCLMIRDEDLFVEIIRYLRDLHASKFLFYPKDVIAYHLELLVDRGLVRLRAGVLPGGVTPASAELLVRQYELVDGVPGEYELDE